MFISWRSNGEIGDRSQKGHIKCTVVSGAVFSNQTGTVQTENHIQLQQGHIVNQIIIGPLEESGIDVTEWQHSFFGHSAGKSYGMSFGNADIKGALGHGFHHDVHGTSGGHGGSNTYYLIILTGKLQQSFSEYVLKAGRFAGCVLYETFSRGGVEHAWCMPFRSLFLGRGKTFSLDGMDVKDARTLHFLDAAQHPDQIFHVVSVYRAEITEVQSFENILLLGEHGLQAVVETDESFPALFIE